MVIQSSRLVIIQLKDHKVSNCEVPTSRSVLLDDIACIVELSKCCRQLVEIITQHVRHEVCNTAVDDFWKPENQLRKFPLLGIVQLYRCTAGCRLDLSRAYICRPRNGSVA